ncbi:MAG: DUF4136 domain-containing protein [Cyclobacteriaceae bacterium]|nr:DUF4136 domain-containing protein [Cyclobacteriaceae bacterium]
MKSQSVNSTTLLFILLAFCLAGCNTSIHNSYDRTIDFTKYKTFCWMTGCEFNFNGPEYLNDSLLRESIKISLIKELESKGLKEDSNNPDLLIGFTIAVKDEQAVIYHRSEDSPAYYQPLPEDREVINYLKGSLIIGMADRVESRIVWQSEAQSYMELNPDFSEKNIRKGIKIVLKDFPPPKKNQ